MNPAATLLEVGAARRRPRKNSGDEIQVEGDGNDFDGSGFEGLQMKNKNKRTMEGVDEECRRIKTERCVSKKKKSVVSKQQCHYATRLKV